MKTFSIECNSVSHIGLRALLIALMLCAPVGFVQGGESKMASVGLAEKLVNQCARIQEGDIVLISGGIRNITLLEDLSTHVRKAGAFPLVTLGSDRIDRDYYDVVPQKYDKQFPELEYELVGMINARIAIAYNENSSLLSDVAPGRLAAVDKNLASMYALEGKRKVRAVYLGNDLDPTSDRAAQFGLPKEELAKIYWGGVNVDYKKLESIGNVVRAKLLKGKTLHITNPNGTDLRVQIEGCQVSVSDGIISESDLQQDTPASRVWLPAGEVYLVPVAGTAHGKIVVDRQLYLGKEIMNLELTFKKGKLQKMKAQSGVKWLRDLYDASGSGKDEFAFVNIGVNPNVKIPEDSKMNAWMASGMVTVGFGGNTWAGGENDSEFGIANHLPGSTLRVDGETIVKSGVLVPR